MSEKVHLEKYSERSHVLRGTTSKTSPEITDAIKKAGGKFNYGLKGGPGWIFSDSRLEEARKLVKSINKGTYGPLESKGKTVSRKTSESSSEEAPVRRRRYRTSGPRAAPKAKTPESSSEEELPKEAVSKTKEIAPKIKEAVTKEEPVTIPKQATSVRPALTKRIGDVTGWNYRDITYHVPTPVVGRYVQIDGRDHKIIKVDPNDYSFEVETENEPWKVDLISGKYRVIFAGEIVEVVFLPRS